MPDPTKSHLYQAILIWDATGVDAYGAFAVADTPREVRGRWEDKQSEALDPQGNVIALDANAIVTVDVAIGSRMWLGSLDDWNALGVVRDQKLMEVKLSNNTPDIRNRWQMRTLGLMRLRTGV